MAASEKSRLFRLASAARRAERKPAPPALAARADDLEAIKKAVDDAGSVGGGLWLSYLFVLFYIAIAAGAVTHQDLLLQNPVKLPFLNIELPLLAFFALAPFLLVITHAYALLHFVMLRNKAWRFSQALETQLPDVVEAPKQGEASPMVIRDQLRRLLPSNIFVQIFAGPPELRKGALGFVMNVMAGTTLTVAPLLVLLLLQFQFLPYHGLWVTNVQRAAIVLDFVFLFVTFCIPILNYARVTVVFVLFLYVLWLSIVVATIPGERQEVFFSDWFNGGARKILFNGDVDSTTRRRKSLFSNTLVVPGFDIYEALKVEDPSKLAWKTTIFDLRGRRLEQAVFDGANLTKVDLTGALMQGGSLSNVSLQKAILDEGYFQDVNLLAAKLEGASFQNVHFERAILSLAQLQGGKFAGVQFQNANLQYAGLEGTWLGGVRLQGASLQEANLQGAFLPFAELEGALLSNAKMFGADLRGARLALSSLREAQLQGASLVDAEIRGADFSDSFLWRANLGSVGPDLLATKRSHEPNFHPLWKDNSPFYQAWETPTRPIPWTTKNYLDLKHLIEALPDDPNKDLALKNILKLDCSKDLAVCDPPTSNSNDSLSSKDHDIEAGSIFSNLPEIFRPKLKLSRGFDNTFQNEIIEILKIKLCKTNPDAIYILRGVLQNNLLFDLGSEPSVIVDFILSQTGTVSIALTSDDKAHLLEVKEKAEVKFSTSTSK